MFYEFCKFFRSIAGAYSPEVLFRRYHVTHLPCGMYAKWDEIPPLGGKFPLQRVPITAKSFCHVTHEQPAYEIIQNNNGKTYFIFKPKSKQGKQGSGETYVICNPTDQPPTEETTYRYLTSTERVFPGYYIWWSINNDDYYPSSYLEDYYYFSPPFTSSSRYGNVKFSGYIMQLLRCYQEAYAKVNPLPRIQFRCGGTLRYKHEICKVVIMCTDAHPLPEDEFPRMWQGHDIRYGRDRKITFVRPLEVTIRNGVSGIIDPYIPYSWDTYAFAFYFPDDTYRLICPTSEKFRYSKIEHDDLCHSLQPNPDGSGKLVCPNELSSPFKSVSSFQCSQYPRWPTSYDDSDSDEDNFIPQKRQRTKYYNSWY